MESFRLRFLVGQLAGALLCLTASASLSAVEVDEERRFLAELRHARLYVVAEDYLAARAGEADLAPELRELYAKERIALLSAAALDAPAEERETRFAAIEKVETDYQATAPPQEAAIEVLLAAAKGRLALADQWRQDADLDATASRDRALAALRAIERELDRGLALSKEFSTEANKKPGSTLERRALALSQELRFVSALVYRARAQCYPEGSPDRFNAQGQAAETLDDLATRMTPDQSAWVRTLAERARAYREIRQFEQAKATLERVAAERQPEDLTPEERDVYYEERLSLLADSGDADAALGLWDRVAPTGEPPSATLGLVAVDLFLARAKQLRKEKDDIRASNWEKKAAEAARYLETRFGPYWGRLAGRRLVDSGGGGSIGDARSLARLAEEQLRRRNLPEAIAAYDRAATVARAEGSSDAGLYAYRAALVEQARRNHGAASDRLVALAKTTTDTDLAAERHYLAIWNASQQAKADPEWVERYEKLLAEHLERYPASPRIDRVRLWSGRLKAFRGDLKQAFEEFVAVSPVSDAFAEAAPAAVETAGRLLADAERRVTNAKPAEIAPLRAALRRSLDAALKAAELNEKADATAAAVLAVGAGRLALEQGASEGQPAGSCADRALALLDRAETSDVSAIRSQALALRVAADFDDPSQDERIDDALAQLAASGMTSLEEAAKALEQALQDDDATRRTAAANRLLEALALLPVAEQNDATQSARAVELRAKALSNLGRGKEALDDVRRMATERPNDHAIQLLYARAISSSPDEADQRAALDRWRRVAQSAATRTDLWFEAKLAVAQRQIALGRAKEAATLLRYVQLAPPGLAGTKWEAPYRDALREAEGKGDSP